MHATPMSKSMVVAMARRGGAPVPGRRFDAQLSACVSRARGVRGTGTVEPRHELGVVEVLLL